MKHRDLVLTKNKNEKIDRLKFHFSTERTSKCVEGQFFSIQVMMNGISSECMWRLFMHTGTETCMDVRNMF